MELGDYGVNLGKLDDCVYRVVVRDEVTNSIELLLLLILSIIEVTVFPFPTQVQVYLAIFVISLLPLSRCQ